MSVRKRFDAEIPKKFFESSVFSKTVIPRGVHTPSNSHWKFMGTSLLVSSTSQRHQPPVTSAARHLTFHSAFLQQTQSLTILMCICECLHFGVILRPK